MRKVQAEYEESQKSANVMKRDYDARVENMGVGHDEAIEEIRMKHRDKKEELDRQWKELDA